MSTKHTPGPWIQFGQLKVLSVPGGASGDGINADDDDGWLIADCSEGFAHVNGQYTELGQDVQVANARLIAAAPELLEALQGLVRAYEALPSAVTHSGSRHSHAVYAIKKATGEEA